MKGRQWSHWLELSFLAVAAICLGFYFGSWLGVRAEQRREQREFMQMVKSRMHETAGAARSPQRVAREDPVSAVLGRLDIPRLGVAAMVREGVDAQTLRQAVGHIPGTALPGDPGNAGLAGHRDTFFRGLKDVRTQDEITFTAADGVRHYRVDAVQIVDPTDVSVLNDTDAATLTLVTCYPFTYVGSAPKRFIVRAVQQDDPARQGSGRTMARMEEAPRIGAGKPSVKGRPRVSKPRPKPAPRPRETRTALARTLPPAEEAIVAAPAKETPAEIAAQTGKRGKGNPVSRFFKAAGRRLGFGGDEPRGSTQSESPDPPSPRR
jgi:LPXTG-site transpeptidase (sortase) family protein